MDSGELTYFADELNMRGEVYMPDGGEHCPAVLVFPEALGLSAHARHRAHQLAKMGYASLACDLHGDAMLLQDMSAVRDLIKPVAENPMRIRARAHASPNGPPCTIRTVSHDDRSADFHRIPHETRD
jgi:dienelactone hydrolase